MKKHLIKYIALLTPMTLLTSCGFGLKELAIGNAYNSTDWNENYYRVWDDKIDVHSENNKITDVIEKDLNKDSDLVFTSYEDNAFLLCEPNARDYVYESDLISDTSYGRNHNMSSIDNSFKYNVTSKLFDGTLFCGGRYEKARVQVGPTNNVGEPERVKDGFGRLFKKELRTADYFAINFKCATDYKTNKSISIPRHYCSIKLKISFFLKNDHGYTQSIVKYDLDNVPANTGDSDRKNDYYFFGFKLKNNEGDHYLDISRCAGIAVQYDLVEDTYSSTYNLGHSIFLYEVLFPHSTWY